MYCNDLFSRFEQQILFLENCLSWRIPRRTVMGTTDRRGGLIPKHLEFWKFGYWNRLSELRNEMTGRTIVGTTDRHRPFNGIESLNSVMEQQDGPSQARRSVTGTTVRHRLRNPRLGRIPVIILRGVLDYSCFNYKVSGLILISLITWGLKEVTLI